MCPPNWPPPTSDDTPGRWERAIALAERQGGAISFAQLREGGISEWSIWALRRRGGLHDRHLGVYALGRPGLTAYGESWAAVLAAGDRGVLAAWSATALMGLTAWPPHPHVVVIGGEVRLQGVHVRRTRRLTEDEITTDPHGLRHTTWPRTVTDLAATSSVADLHTVLDVLDRHQLLDLTVLHTAITRANGRAGLRKLRRALIPFETVPVADYRSLLERFSAMLLHASRIPPHEINGPVDLPNGRTIAVDILFRDQLLAIEVDGRDSHNRAVQFQIDRERDRELQKLGYRVLRFTWHDVKYHPRRVVSDIRALL